MLLAPDVAPLLWHHKTRWKPTVLAHLPPTTVHEMQLCAAAALTAEGRPAPPAALRSFAVLPDDAPLVRFFFVSLSFTM